MDRISKIIVNCGSEKTKISKMIYSNFIEHLGDCIHNGIWMYDDLNVPMVEENSFLVGVRKDVLNAIKKLNPPVLRAFGGCYSDVYHWKDAIGPRDLRKKVKNKYWGAGIRRFIRGLGPKIENQFGTDEFLHLCEEIGAEAYLNVNYGTGTPQEAADWVEYCNGSKETEYGSLRVEYGRENPYNVKFWGIANEIFGWWETGSEKYPEDYAKRYLEFAKAMRKKDPNIKLVAVGCEKPGWNQTLLKLIGEEFVDYLSIHKYLPGLWSTFIRRKHPHNKRLYHALMASKSLYADLIERTWEDINATLGEDTHVRIAFDEWGVWYLAKDIIRTNYNLQDGLWTALMLMVFQRKAEKCPMANWAQLINCIGTFQTRKDALWMTPVYHALQMINSHAKMFLIDDVKIMCPQFDAKKYAHIPKRKNNAFIECNVTIDESSKELAILVLNKYFSQDTSVSFTLNNFDPASEGNWYQLYSNSPFDYNTKENPQKISIEVKKMDFLSKRFEITLEPHSFSILKLKHK